MELHRLTPTSLHVKSRYAGRCGACERPIEYRERIVHLYGEAFHHDCAFYRTVRDGVRSARARPA
jgi:hypothetical protein